MIIPKEEEKKAEELVAEEIYRYRSRIAELETECRQATKSSQCSTERWHAWNKRARLLEDLLDRCQEFDGLAGADTVAAPHKPLGA